MFENIIIKHKVQSCLLVQDALLSLARLLCVNYRTLP
jgi:hypothetical protein